MGPTAWAPLTKAELVYHSAGSTHLLRDLPRVRDDSSSEDQPSPWWQVDCTEPLPFTLEGTVTHPSWNQ